MKFKVKKYLYLINDISNAMLKKERIHDKEIAHQLRIALIIVSIALVVSFCFNIYYAIK